MSIDEHDFDEDVCYEHVCAIDLCSYGGNEMAEEEEKSAGKLGVFMFML